MASCSSSGNMPPELFREADIEGRSLTTYLAINRIQELVATQPEQEGPQERVRRYLIPILKRVYMVEKLLRHALFISAIAWAY
ncbi:hypothetical protein MaudCBS49596_002852 [Microsporum audouinii]